MMQNKINEAVSVGVLAPTEIRQVIQGLTVSLLPPEEVGVLDPVSHRINDRGAIFNSTYSELPAWMDRERKHRRNGLPW